ncbi:MAG TPA: zinc-dependent peptidase [Cyclobacteriaceae bacterium]|nr:zinc-dependent peptidase [Cyclobacteriaceae bacterium]
MSHLFTELIGELIGGTLKLIYALYEEIRFQLYFSPLIHRVLRSNNPYFIHLRTDQQNQFLRKVRDNYLYFQFVPIGTKLKKRQKIIIAAAAAKLILFLPDEALSYFTKILVYPDYYRSRITGRMHKGEVNPGLQVIVFSKKGIVGGNKIHDDGINLLHHEFAHALWLEHKLVGHSYDVLDAHLVNQFEEYAAKEINAIQNIEGHFFRKYAFENQAEFFAVAVENLFERPGLFQMQQPLLFDILVALFKQNPLAVSPKAFRR